VRYTNYTNMDTFFRAYEPGDRLVKGWEGEVEASDDLRGTLDRIFARHNRDDRPDGQLCPSMSIGDVVVLEGEAFSVDAHRFHPVVLHEADLITDRTWREVER